jgi:hypothetical protein
MNVKYTGTDCAAHNGDKEAGNEGSPLANERTAGRLEEERARRIVVVVFYKKKRQLGGCSGGGEYDGALLLLCCCGCVCVLEGACKWTIVIAGRRLARMTTELAPVIVIMN